MKQNHGKDARTPEHPPGLEGEGILREYITRILIDACGKTDGGAQVIVQRPYVTAEIKAVTPEGVTIFGTGVSKVCLPDEWDEDTGIRLAIQRAFKSASKWIIDGIWLHEGEAGMRARIDSAAYYKKMGHPPFSDDEMRVKEFWKLKRPKADPDERLVESLLPPSARTSTF